MARLLACVVLGGLLCACSPPSVPTAIPGSTGSPGPEPSAVTFGDGEHRVGVDVEPGTYRAFRPSTANPEDFCYWERVAGFGGSDPELLGNSGGFGSRVVTIGPTDAGFISEHCGTWTSDLSPVSGSVGDGVWIVGTDVQPGRYVSAGGLLCLWQRLSGFGGHGGELLEGGTTGEVTIGPADVGFSSSHCGEWRPAAR